MSVRRSVQAVIIGILFLGLSVLGPAPASATNMWFQQALFLAHIPLGGGQFFTTNYTVTATENATTVNVKCFNDNAQRIGPAAGVNISFSAQGQVFQHTPTSLGVTTDALFTGNGWCWARATTGTNVDFNVETNVGVTTDLTPGGVLSSPGSSFIGTSSGLGDTSNGNGGVPFWTTASGAQHFLVVINPLGTTINIALRLFDTNGIAQGAANLNRSLSTRAMLALNVPSAFGLPTPPTSGTIRITSGSPQGYLGWYLQVYANGRVVFNPIGLDGDDVAQLPAAGAP